MKGDQNLKAISINHSKYNSNVESEFINYEEVLN